jgi:two-component system LytT family response regulator
VGHEKHLSRDSIASIETRLPANHFIRINRSAIVNIEHIRELQPLARGEYSVVLYSGDRLILSRDYLEKLQQLGV